MSLQSSTELARTNQPIIDPRSLSIEAMYVSGPHIESEPNVLHMSDIRETGTLGYIVDDSDKIMPLDDLIRLQEIINFKFNLIGNHVVAESGETVGRVFDFTYESTAYQIQQIYVKPPFLKSLSHPTVIIHLKQIISVTNEKIVVKRPDIRVKEKRPNQALINPFRSQSQPEIESSFNADRMSS